MVVVLGFVFSSQALAGPTLEYSAFVGVSDNNSDGARYGVDVVTDASSNRFLLMESGTGRDIWVVKLDSSGRRIWQTKFGGSGSDKPRAIALDSSGIPVIAGRTTSADLPFTSSLDSTLSGLSDAFYAKFSALSGALMQGAYLGGSGQDHAWGVAVDSQNRVVVVGQANYANFPTKNSIVPIVNNAAMPFVTRYSSDGTSIEFSSVFNCQSGCNAYASSVAVDSADRILLGGATSNTIVAPATIMMALLL